DNRPPLLRLTGIINPDPTANRTFVTVILSRETSVNNRHRLFGIGVVNGEVAAFQNLQTERRKIVIRDRLEVSPGPIAVRRIVLTVRFILALARKGHAKAIA